MAIRPQKLFQQEICLASPYIDQLHKKLELNISLLISVTHALSFHSAIILLEKY